MSGVALRAKTEDGSRVTTTVIANLFLRYAQTPLFQSGSPVSRIVNLDPTQRLDRRGGFEIAFRKKAFLHSDLREA